METRSFLYSNLVRHYATLRICIETNVKEGGAVLGLEDRFGKKDDDEKDDKLQSQFDDKDSKKDKDKDKDDKSSDDKDDKKSSDSGGKKKDSILDKASGNPYASNLKDAMTGKKSKSQAGMDAAKKAAKTHAKAIAAQAAVPAAYYGGMGLVGLYLFNQSLLLLQGLYTSIMSGTFGALIDAIASAAVNIAHFVAHAASAATHAISGFLHSVGSFVSGAVHAVGGSSAAATAASIAAQVVVCTSPIAVAAVLVTGTFETKYPGDDNTCDVIQETAHYGKLGTAKYYKNNPDKTAFSIYKALKKGGYTDQLTFAILGNLYVESTFNPGNVNSDGGAFGLVQWYSGRTKEVQDFAEKHHATKDDINAQLGYMDYELSHGYKNARDSATRAKSLDEATSIICNEYERPGANHEPPRISKAKYYRDLFKDGTFKSGSKSSADNNDDIAADASSEDCGDGASTADWTGTIKESISNVGMHYSWDGTPKDIKAYIHSPEKVGMKFRQDGDGWIYGGGTPAGNNNSSQQCVFFANNYFLKIHGLGKGSWATGNGQDLVTNFSKKLGGKISKLPNQGAIASVKGGASGGNLERAVDNVYYGHTFVVSHVLKNGTLIGLEENMSWAGKDMSGIYTQQVDWNVIVLPKDTYTKWKIKFFTPNNEQHKLRWSNKDSND